MKRVLLLVVGLLVGATIVDYPQGLVDAVNPFASKQITSASHPLNQQVAQHIQQQYGARLNK